MAEAAGDDVAVLDDGPAAGERVPVQRGRILPPLYLQVDVMPARRAAETVDWRETRYERAPLFKTRRPGDVEWLYFRNPAPAELA